MSEQHSQNCEFQHQHAQELFALKARLDLLAAYAKEALDVDSPHRGLALYLAEERDRVDSIASRFFDSKWN